MNEEEIKKRQGSFWALGCIFGVYMMDVFQRLHAKLLEGTASLPIALLIILFLTGAGYFSLIMLGRYYERA